MQTQDKGESVHNVLEFFQPLLRLYQGGKNYAAKSFLLLILIIIKLTL